MKIGELAQKTGLAASTIRFYEERGLLPPPVRAANGYRQYPADAITRLHQVRAAQRLGFSLEVTRLLFTEGGACLKDKTLAQTLVRLDEVAAMQATLEAQRCELEALRDLLSSTAPDAVPACSHAVSPMAPAVGAGKRPVN